MTDEIATTIATTEKTLQDAAATVETKVEQIQVEATEAVETTEEEVLTFVQKHRTAIEVGVLLASLIGLFAVITACG